MEIEYAVTEHRYKNCICRIHRPINLPEEERNKRIEACKRAMVEVWKEMHKDV
jgi:hypothetical protein